MAAREPDWVPAGAWLAPGYAEWAPPAALRGMVACLWASVVPSDADRTTLVLPDACSDLIWEQGVGSYVAGPDTGPVRTVAKAGTVIVGVRFRPSAGGTVLGLPLSEVRDQRVALSDLLPAAARRLPATLSPIQAAARTLNVAGGLIVDADPDNAAARAAALLRDPAARAEAVAADVGLSERQLRRRVEAAAGYGPKTLQRVLRFQRFVRMLDAATERPDLALAAAETGYADQAHLTRECSAFSGVTPTTLVRVRHEAGSTPADQWSRIQSALPWRESGTVPRPIAHQASGGSAIMAVPISRKPSRA
jgi:AraC-like DNA-binding protein